MLVYGESRKSINVNFVIVFLFLIHNNCRARNSGQILLASVKPRCLEIVSVNCICNLYIVCQFDITEIYSLNLNQPASP